MSANENPSISQSKNDVETSASKVENALNPDIISKKHCLKSFSTWLEVIALVRNIDFTTLGTNETIHFLDLFFHF